MMRTTSDVVYNSLIYGLREMIPRAGQVFVSKEIFGYGIRYGLEVLYDDFEQIFKNCS